MAVVAREHLVAPVPGERDSHVAPGHLRHQQRRQLRGIGEGLVVELGQPGHEREGVGRRELDAGVVGAQVPRHGNGLTRLVEACGGHGDGEGADGSVALRLHERDDRGRVDTA